MRRTTERSERIVLPRAFILFVVALAGWTAAVLVAPDLRATYRAPGARTAVEAITVGVTAFIAALAGIRFSVDRAWRWLLVAAAFAVMAVNQAVFGLVVDVGTVSLSDPAYIWIVARLGAGVLAVAGAYASGISFEQGAGRVFAVWLAACLLTVGLAQAVVIARGSALPSLGTSAADGSVTASPVAIVLGLLGLALFSIAAYGTLTWWPPQERIRSWLAAAFVIAGFAHLHYAIVPTVFTDSIATGDMLRLAMATLLTASLLVDMRDSVLAERDRARDLAEAYVAEHERVRSLEDLERTKADLLRMLAHELLHPVAAIRTLATALEKGNGRLDEETRIRATHAIVEHSGQLRELVERAPALDRLRFDMTLERRPRLVRELIETVRRTFPHLEGRLSCVVDPDIGGTLVSVDSARLMQVFHNLFSNAEKYAPARSPIEVEVECAGTDVLFHVRDGGAGIPADRAEPLFEPFVRIDAAPGASGSGVGLHIVRAVVEAHGGRAWIDASGVAGSSIAFTVPIEGTIS